MSGLLRKNMTVLEAQVAWSEQDTVNMLFKFSGYFLPNGEKHIFHVPYRVRKIIVDRRYRDPKIVVHFGSTGKVVLDPTTMVFGS